jgi:hypothetical protein
MLFKLMERKKTHGGRDFLSGSCVTTAQDMCGARVSGYRHIRVENGERLVSSCLLYFNTEFVSA